MKRFILLWLLLLAPVTALTASPASHFIPYHAGEERYIITVMNDEQRSLTLTLTPTGPLANTITVQRELTLAPGERRDFTVSIRLPDSTQPGILENGILIEAKPLSAATVAATTAVMHVIRVETPKEGTYLAGELLSSAGILGDDNKLTLSITNTGTQPITDATVLIRVAGQQYDLPVFSLAPGASSNFVATWKPMKIGSYDATAAVQYAGKQATFVTSIIIGNLSVRILGIDIGSFRLGDPFRVSLIAMNEWGAALPVSAKITMEQQGILMAAGESTALQAQPLTQVAIPIFLESNTLQPGNATLFVQLFYADKKSTATYPLSVSVDALTIITPQRSTNYLPIFIVVLLLIFIVITTRIFIKKWGLTKR